MTGSRLALIALIALTACEGPADPPDPPPGSCDPVKGETPVLEVSHYGTFDALGEVLYCGIPPQGGAPYAPFGVRFAGVEPEADGGVRLTIDAVDTTSGELVGSGEFFERFLCSNVGESEGYWVAAEFHLRFSGYSLDDLHGREVAVHFLAEGVDDSVELTKRFAMDCVPGT